MTQIAAKWGIGRPKDDAPLQEHIDWYVGQGYQVISQTETSAQLVKRKRFSVMWALLWTLVVLVGFFVYLLYYLVKKDQGVYLSVKADGTIQARKS